MFFKRKELSCLVLFLCFLGFSDVCGEQAAYDAGEVVVTARGSSEDILTREEIVKPDVSDSVLESMKDLPGVQLRRTAVSGNENNKLRIRGMGETRLRVMKNGIPVQRDGSYGNGPVDWGALSHESVESIEIQRGVISAKYGNAFGGAVDLVTKKPGDEVKTNLSSSFGSLSTQKHELVNSGKFGMLGWMVSGGRYESDGYLRNNSVERNSYQADLFLNPGAGFEIFAGISHNDMETGMVVYNRPDSPWYDGSEPDSDSRALAGPGIDGRLINGDRSWGDGSYGKDSNTAVTVSVLKKIGQGHGKIFYRWWEHEKEERYLASDTGKKIYERKTEAEPGNWLAGGEVLFKLGKHRMEFGGKTRSSGWGDQDVRFIDETYFNGSINHPFFAFIRDGFKGQPGIILHNSFYLQDLWSISDRIDIEAGVRQELFKADSIDPDAFGFVWNGSEKSLDESDTDPRLKLNLRPWEGAKFQAGMGLVHRYPTSPEYFWWYMNNGTGFFNADLNSERSLQYELAFEQKLDWEDGRAGFEIRSYYYEIEDYISSQNVPGVGPVYYNIDEVVIKGIEAGLSFELPFEIEVYTNLTLQKGDKKGDPWDSEDRLEGQIPDLPAVMANTGIKFRPFDEFSISLAMNHVGGREHLSNAGELVKMSSYTLWGADLSWAFLKKSHSMWTFTASAENIFGKEYEEEKGYPMPESVYMAGISVAF